MGVVTKKQWIGLIAMFLGFSFFFFFDMLFPRVQIVVFSDTAAADMEAVLQRVDEEVSIRQGRAAEAEQWEVDTQPEYLVLAYGYGDELGYGGRRWYKRWFSLHRTDDLESLIRYLSRDWNLWFWRMWLAS